MFVIKKLSLISFLLVLALIGSPFWVLAGPVEDIEAQINARQKEIEKLEAQAKVFQGSISAKQKEAKNLKNQIAIFEAQIAKLEADISITKSRITEAELQIESLGLQINQKEADILKQRQNITATINAVYEYDQEDILSLMLKTNNVSEILSQAQYVESLQGDLQNKLEEIKNLKAALEMQKSQVETFRQGQETLKDSLGVKQDALGGEKGSKEVLLKKTKGEESKYQALQNEALRQRNLLAEQIKELEAQIYKEQNFLMHLTAAIPSAGPIFSWPETNYVITQGYGMTSYAKLGAYAGSPHNGVDASSGLGSEIRAIGDGKVVAKGYNAFWGNWVAIQHTNGLVSAYGHMAKPAIVAASTIVTKNTIIGYEGRTGNATGPHVHLSIYNDFFTYQKNGQLYFNQFQGSLNPLNYLP